MSDLPIACTLRPATLAARQRDLLGGSFATRWSPLTSQTDTGSGSRPMKGFCRGMRWSLRPNGNVAGS